MPVVGKWTALDVAEALIKSYLDEWSCANLFEFEMPSDEYDDGNQRSVYCRRTDLLTIFCGGVSERSAFVRQRSTTAKSRMWFRSLPYGWRSAFEIKTSRADFAVDARQSWKHTPIRRAVNELFFVYPRGLVDITEDWRAGNADERFVGTGDGAIEVYRDERKRWEGSLRAQIVRTPTPSLMVETTREFVDQLARRTLRGRATVGMSALVERKRNPWPFLGPAEAQEPPAPGVAEGDAGEP